jgi:DnaJ-class molecular chaperone
LLREERIPGTLGWRWVLTSAGQTHLENYRQTVKCDKCQGTGIECDDKHSYQCAGCAGTGRQSPA